MIGSLAPSSKLGLTVTLTPRDPAALRAYAAAVSDPGSSEYHRYLTVGEFAARFGPSPSSVDAVRASLAARGLKLAGLSPSHLALLVQGDAGTVSNAFSTPLQRISLPGGRTGFANQSAPRVAGSVAGDIQGIVGLDTIAQPQPLGLRSRADSEPTPAVAHTTTSDSAPAPCSAATTAQSQTDNSGAYTIDQIASAYGFDGLYDEGDEGAGQTIGLYELEQNTPSDITAFQSCFGTDATVTYQTVDAGQSAPAAEHQEGLETELDAENVIGLDPQASVVVYQGPDTDQGDLDTYEAMISQDKVNVISTSWGDCEADLTDGTAQAENTLFQEAAAQGQTVVAAAGDDGAQDCYDDSTKETGPAVDDPASQPFVTGVGGTTLSSTSPLTQSVWNDGGASGAGGGGDSSLWTMPAYQSNAAASLKVVNSQSSATPCTASTGDCREVPDVSADADPDTGYLIYYSGGAGRRPGRGSKTSDWTTVGGTSGAAPVWAAVFALANDTNGCSNPLGFANPSLYSTAGDDYNSSFSDITSGDNDMLGDNGGEFAAGTGYDQASGLGTPIASALAPALCNPSLVLTDPGAQTSTAGSAVSLQLQADDAAAGATVTYAAQGLPTGLSLDTTTGLISGTPTTAGSSEVTVYALDNDGSTASRTFAWTISPATTTSTTTSASSSTSSVTTTTSSTTTTAPVASPTARSVSLSTPGAQHTRLRHATRLQLQASDTDGAALSYLAAGLPPGLTLNDSTGTISGIPTRAGIYNVTVEAVAPGFTAAVRFLRWTIAALPSISDPLVRGISVARATLGLQLNAGLDGPALKTVSLHLPRGLSLSGNGRSLARRISVHSGEATRRFGTRLSGGRLTLSLRSTARDPHIKISAPALTASPHLIRLIREHHDPLLVLSVTVTDATKLATKISATLRVS